MKRTIALVMALLMIGMTGCGAANDASKSGGEVGSSTENTAGEAAKDGKAKVLKWATANTTAMWNDEEMDLMAAEKYFQEQLPVVTEGRYEVQFYLDGQLASGTSEQLQGVKSGVFDITDVGCANLGEFTNAFAEISVPYMYQNQDVVDEILNGEVGQDMMDRAVEDIGGVVPMFYADNGFRMLTNADKKITCPDDLKGVKLRVQSDEIMIATFEALGASIVSVSYSELFTALQQKLVDAEENPATNIYNQKFYEVQKYCTVTNHMFTAFAYFMNEDVFQSMSEEDQKAVEKLCKECQAIRAEKMKECTDKYMEKLEAEGLDIYYLSNDEYVAFKDAMTEKVWPKCEEIMGTERWNKLNTAVGDAETKLGL